MSDASPLGVDRRTRGPVRTGLLSLWMACALAAPFPGAGTIPHLVPSAGEIPLLAPGAGEIPHPELRLAVPAPDAVTRGPVEVIELTFSEAVDQVLSRILLYTAEGEAISAGETRWITPDARDRISLELDEPLPTGMYRVEWRTAASDGHIIQGTYSFAVVEEEAQDEEAPGSDGVPQDDEAPQDSVDLGAAPDSFAGSAIAPGGDPTASVLSLPRGTIVRWLHLIGVVLLLGTVAFRFGVLGRLARPGDLPVFTSVAFRGIHRAAWGAVLLLLVTLALRFQQQLTTLGEGMGEGFFHLLFATGWGAGWFVHLAAVVLGIAGLFLAAPEGQKIAGWRVLGVAALLLPLSLALQGHAWSTVELRAQAVTALYLHVLAAGIWLGGLWLLLAIGLPSIRAGRKAEDPAFGGGGGLPPLARLVNAFSRVALIAVGLLIVTGGFQSWLHLGNPTLLLTTTYGRTLLLKYVGVLGVLVLGFYNWRRVRPALAANADAGQLRIPATLEALIGLVVLAITSVLVATSPP